MITIFNRVVLATAMQVDSATLAIEDRNSVKVGPWQLRRVGHLIYGENVHGERAPIDDRYDCGTRCGHRECAPRFATVREAVIAVRGDVHCHLCQTMEVRPEPCGVQMCTACGRWYDHEGELPEMWAAAHAVVPMDPYECLAALDAAAERMEIY